MSRDSQRSKVYKAERVLGDGDIRLETVDEITAYLNKLMNSAWYQRRWPNATAIRVKDGRSRRRAGASRMPWGGEITMPVWSRNRYLVLHELAHIVRPVKPDMSAHDRDFCKVYLELVKHGMGREAWEKLRTSFKAHRVKWIQRSSTRPKGIVPESLRVHAMNRAAGRRNDG